LRLRLYVYLIKLKTRNHKTITMNKNVLIYLIMCTYQLSLGQNRPEKKSSQIKLDSISFYEGLTKYSVLSTEIKNDNKESIAVLRFNLLDLEDKKFKTYDAYIDDDEYVGLTTIKWGWSAISHISIVTVPFKIRQKNELGYVTAKADVKNIGVYLPFLLWDNKRYWLDNSVSNHKYSVGFILAPMVEDVNDKNTNNFFGDPNKSYSAFMFSTSLAVTYTYKSFTFAIVPIGFDWGTDQAGKKWINNGKYWWGFGIGVDTKLLGF